MQAEPNLAGGKKQMVAALHPWLRIPHSTTLVARQPEQGGSGQGSFANGGSTPSIVWGQPGQGRNEKKKTGTKHMLELVAGEMLGVVGTFSKGDKQ
jgi:hypothetical protein